MDNSTSRLLPASQLHLFTLFKISACQTLFSGTDDLFHAIFARVRYRKMMPLISSPDGHRPYTPRAQHHDEERRETPSNMLKSTKNTLPTPTPSS